MSQTPFLGVFPDRILAAVRPGHLGLALVGGPALRLHGMHADEPGELRFATTDKLVEPAWQATESLHRAGFDVSAEDASPRVTRLTVHDPVTEQTCVVDLLREDLAEPVEEIDGVPVVSLIDAAGLVMRDLHERGTAADVVNVASVRGLYSYRELEGLGRDHLDDFAAGELADRLDAAEMMPLPREIRSWALAWAEDIRLRRPEEGDTDW
ncbi:nucleotidyl transferase AbiEii/AbiGii toxin family protein [Herbidospora sp. RD11066]